MGDFFFNQIFGNVVIVCHYKNIHMNNLEILGRKRCLKRTLILDKMMNYALDTIR